MKKYVFIDIDGTLFDHKNHCVPESAKKALKLAKDNGHELFICTGRPKPVVESSYLQLPVSGMVCAGGGHIIAGKETIFTAHFPKDEMMKILDYFYENQVEYTLEGIERNYYSKQSMEMFRDYFCGKESEDSEMSRKFAKREELKLIDDITEDDYGQVSKIDLFAKNDDRIREYIRNLPDTLEGFVYSVPIGELIEAEILVTGISKASGIDRVVEYFGADLKDTIAIGDSTNDLPMIEHAQVGIAMGSASDEVKKAADYVTKDVSDDGLYHAFEMMKLI